MWKRKNRKLLNFGLDIDSRNISRKFSDTANKIIDMYCSSKWFSNVILFEIQCKQYPDGETYLFSRIQYYFNQQQLLQPRILSWFNSILQEPVIRNGKRNGILWVILFIYLFWDFHFYTFVGIKDEFTILKKSGSFFIREIEYWFLNLFSTVYWAATYCLLTSFDGNLVVGLNNVLFIGLTK